MPCVSNPPLHSVFVCPADFGWSDVGTWGSLITLSEKDTNGNAAIGPRIELHECSNCIVHTTEERRVVIQGLDGYIVAEKDGTLLILSMGGSLGARAVNEAVCGLIANKKDDHDCMFLHAMGGYGLWVPDKLRELGVDPDSRDDIEIREYIDDMEVCMPAADLIISRAGASSLYEIRALGKASILIPSPNVAENHQYFNAMELVNNNAAEIIEEKDLTPESLTELVNQILSDENRIAEMSDNAKSMAILNSTDLIVENILKLIK